MLRTYLFWTLSVVVSVHCFQRLQQQQKGISRHTQVDDSKEGLFPPKIRDQLLLQDRQTLQWDSSSTKVKECRCPPDGSKQSDDDYPEDVISDFGEAAFAMLGSIWAEEGNLLPTSLLFPQADSDKELRVGEQHHEQHHDRRDDLSTTRIHALLERLANHPYAKQANLEEIATQVMQ